MLRQIWSDKFISNGEVRPPITFNGSLNVVQGTETGSNSIGKSTFLLVIDFVFGGDDYARQPTIQAEIGAHTVCFCFEFDGEHHYFSRNTGEITRVNICDKDYNPISEIGIGEFRERLFALYKIDRPDITFRDIIGRYFRIYGRENLNEKRPLDAVPEEKGEKSVSALLKLYGRYSSIADIKEKLDDKVEEKTALSKAQTYGFLTKITATEYKENLKRLEVLKAELEELAAKGGVEFTGVDVNQAEQVAEMQANITSLKRQKSRLWAQYYAVKDSSAFSRPATERDFQALLNFFPDVNLRELEEVEGFHSQLSVVLAEEFAEAQKNILAMINASEAEIKTIEVEIQKVNLPQKMSRATLEAFSKLKTQIDALEAQNSLYNQQGVIETELKSVKEQFEILSMAQIKTVESEINRQMAEINDFIYSGKTKPPTLNITKLNAYGFFTPVDDGTGTNYKNLVVFDISTLQSTPLPALTHDTVIFKHIAVEPIERIIELYAKSKKQVFIAFDRTHSYTEATQNILETNTVLRLSANGNELYGRSWNNKQ